MITTTETECNGYIGLQVLWKHKRRVTLILALRLREGFVEEKLGLQGWRGFYRQDRGMWSSREKERNEQTRKICKAHLGKVEQMFA